MKKLKNEKTKENKSHDEKVVDEKRRDMLKRLKRLSFVAPVTLATMSMKANACSLSC